MVGQSIERRGRQLGIAEDATLDRLIRRADVAIYQAKRSGRDRIVLSDTFAVTDSHEEGRGVARVGVRVS